MYIKIILPELQFCWEAQVFYSTSYCSHPGPSSYSPQDSRFWDQYSLHHSIFFLNVLLAQFLFALSNGWDIMLIQKKMSKLNFMFSSVFLFDFFRFFLILFVSFFNFILNSTFEDYLTNNSDLLYMDMLSSILWTCRTVFSMWFPWNFYGGYGVDFSMRREQGYWQKWLYDLQN